MDRNEFIRERLAQDARLYRGLAIVAAIAAAGAVVAGIVAIARGLIAGGITMIGFGAFFALDVKLKRSTMSMYLDALDEIGDDPTDIELRDDLSQKTEALLDGTMLRLKDYRAQIIAYAAIGVTMLAGAAVIFAVALGEPGFLPFAVLLVGGALLLFRLAAVAAHNLKIARQVIEFEEREFAERFGDGDGED